MEKAKQQIRAQIVQFLPVSGEAVRLQDVSETYLQDLQQ